MEQKLRQIAHDAEEVARLAFQLAANPAQDHGKLHQAMLRYRAAAVAYLAHPSVSDYVRADARNYDGATREAIERIADLIDELNKP